MNVSGILILYSTDTFSEHNSQIRSSLSPYILMATFPMQAFWNIENIDMILKCRFFLDLASIVTSALSVNRFY